jgi:hypothetical protein
MVEENNTPAEEETAAEETLFERAMRKLADAESVLYASAENKNSLDGAIGREL